MNSLQPYLNSSLIEAGCDEAGRGCLSGPVVAGAVILNPDKKIAGLDDSKKLSEPKRKLLRKIIEKKAISFCVSKISPLEIDKINISEKSLEAINLRHTAAKKTILTINQLKEKINHKNLDKLSLEKEYDAQSTKEFDLNRELKTKQNLHQHLKENLRQFEKRRELLQVLVEQSHTQEIIQKISDIYDRRWNVKESSKSKN